MSGDSAKSNDQFELNWLSEVTLNREPKHGSSIIVPTRTAWTL